MFKKLVPYDQGQELALKYLWTVLQVTSNVAHDAFLILYSHLDNTDGGEKSIHQYCVENDKKFVYEELLDDGYTKELLKISPKNAKHFDLKVTRTLMEWFFVNKFEEKCMFKVLRIMKDFNYLRNDLCHLKLESLEDRGFKFKLQGLWEKLKILYKSVCELTGTTYSSHLTEDLDSTLSSLIFSVDTKENKCRDCKGRDKIRGGSRTRGTSQSSEDSGYFEPEKNTKHSAKEISGSLKKTNTKRNMKEKWVQTSPPRKSTLKNAHTQVEIINKVDKLKAEERNISKTIPVPPKNETVSVRSGIPAVIPQEEVKSLIALMVHNSNPEDNCLSKNYTAPSTNMVVQGKPSKDVHKNTTFPVNKRIPSTFSNLTSGVLTGGQEASGNFSHESCDGLPSYAENSFKTHSNGRTGREEECFGRERGNFSQYGAISKNTLTTSASGTGTGSNCASSKHSSGDTEPLANSTHSTPLTSRKVNTGRSNKSATSEHGKDAEPKGEATKSDQQKCTCRDGSASREVDTDASFVQLLFICIMSCVMFCFRVLAVCIYDFVDKVKRECHLRWLKNSTRLIINAHTGLGQFAHVVHIQGECLVLHYHPLIRVIPRMPHDHHHQYHPPNLPRPKRFGRRRW